MILGMLWVAQYEGFAELFSNWEYPRWLIVGIGTGMFGWNKDLERLVLFVYL